MSMIGPGAVDLALTKEATRDAKAQERMLALQMCMDMHARGVPVFVQADADENAKVNLSQMAPKKALAQVHDAVSKWQKFIFDGQAIGG